VRMNETDMMPHIIEIFWMEKLRFTQYCFLEISKIPVSQLEVSTVDRPKSISWALDQMAAFDRNFAFYLPISIRFASFFFLGKVDEAEIEKDIESIRDKFTPPAFPNGFFNINITAAKDLMVPPADPTTSKLMKEWRLTLLKIEERLSRFTEEDAYRKRYVSLSGLHTVPGAINVSTEYCHGLWHNHASPYIKNES